MPEPKWKSIAEQLKRAGKRVVVDAVTNMPFNPLSIARNPLIALGPSPSGLAARYLIPRLLNPLRDAAGDAIAEHTGIDELINRARSYLDSDAPALKRSVQTFVDVSDPMFGARYTAGRAGWNAKDIASGGDIDPIGRALREYRSAMRVEKDLMGGVREPIFYGISRATGTDHSSRLNTDGRGRMVVDPETGNPARTKDGKVIYEEVLTRAGPFSGTNQRMVEAAAEKIDNPILRGAAKAGIQGVELATSPLSYIPVGGQARIAGRVIPGLAVTRPSVQMGLGLAGVGGFGGATVGGNVARGALMLGSANIAGEVLKDTVGPEAGLAGSLVTPIAATLLAGRLPGRTGRLFADIPDPADRWRRIEAIAAARDVKLSGQQPLVSRVSNWVVDNPRQSLPVAGALLGASTGDSPQERARNAALYAGVGFAGSHLIGQGPSAAKAVANDRALTSALSSELREQLGDTGRVLSETNRPAAAGSVGPGHIQGDEIDLTGLVQDDVRKRFFGVARKLGVKIVEAEPNANGKTAGEIAALLENAGKNQKKGGAETTIALRRDDLAKFLNEQVAAVVQAEGAKPASHTRPQPETVRETVSNEQPSTAQQVVAMPNKDTDKQRVAGGVRAGGAGKKSPRLTPEEERVHRIAKTLIDHLRGSGISVVPGRASTEEGRKKVVATLQNTSTDIPESLSLRDVEHVAENLARADDNTVDEFIAEFASTLDEDARAGLATNFRETSIEGYRMAPKPEPAPEPKPPLSPGARSARGRAGAAARWKNVTESRESLREKARQVRKDAYERISTLISERHNEREKLLRKKEEVLGRPDTARKAKSLQNAQEALDRNASEIDRLIRLRERAAPGKHGKISDVVSEITSPKQVKTKKERDAERYQRRKLASLEAQAEGKEGEKAAGETGKVGKEKREAANKARRVVKEKTGTEPGKDPLLDAIIAASGKGQKVTAQAVREVFNVSARRARRLAKDAKRAIKDSGAPSDKKPKAPSQETKRKAAEAKSSVEDTAAKTEKENASARAAERLQARERNKMIREDAKNDPNYRDAAEHVAKNGRIPNVSELKKMFSLPAWRAKKMFAELKREFPQYVEGRKPQKQPVDTERVAARKERSNKIKEVRENIKKLAESGDNGEAKKLRKELNAFIEATKTKRVSPEEQARLRNMTPGERESERATKAQERIAETKRKIDQVKSSGNQTRAERLQKELEHLEAMDEKARNRAASGGGRRAVSDTVQLKRDAERANKRIANINKRIDERNNKTRNKATVEAKNIINETTQRVNRERNRLISQIDSSSTSNVSVGGTEGRKQLDVISNILGEFNSERAAGHTNLLPRITKRLTHELHKAGITIEQYVTFMSSEARWRAETAKAQDQASRILEQARKRIERNEQSRIRRIERVTNPPQDSTKEQIRVLRQARDMNREHNSGRSEAPGKTVPTVAHELMKSATKPQEMPNGTVRMPANGRIVADEIDTLVGQIHDGVRSGRSIDELRALHKQIGELADFAGLTTPIPPLRALIAEALATSPDGKLIGRKNAQGKRIIFIQFKPDGTAKVDFGTGRVRVKADGGSPRYETEGMHDPVGDVLRELGLDDISNPTKRDDVLARLLTENDPDFDYRIAGPVPPQTANSVDNAISGIVANNAVSLGRAKRIVNLLGVAGRSLTSINQYANSASVPLGKPKLLTTRARYRVLINNITRLEQELSDAHALLKRDIDEYDRLLTTTHSTGTKADRDSLVSALEELDNLISSSSLPASAGARQNAAQTLSQLRSQARSVPPPPTGKSAGQPGGAPPGAPPPPTGKSAGQPAGTPPPPPPGKSRRPVTDTVLREAFRGRTGAPVLGAFLGYTAPPEQEGENLSQRDRFRRALIGAAYGAGLHATVPRVGRTIVRHPALAGTAFGGLAGATQWDASDSPQERIAKVAIGSGIGLGGGKAGPRLWSAGIDAVAPSVHRAKEVNAAQRQYDSFNETGHIAAVRERAELEDAYNRFEKARANGGVGETPARARITNRLIANAKDSVLAKMIDDNRTNLAIVRDNDRNGYTLSPEARAALDEFDDAFTNQGNFDVSFGSIKAADLIPGTYQNHIWGDRLPPPAKGIIAHRQTQQLGKRPGFVLKRQLGSLQEGMSLGFTPSTLDARDLLARRVDSGYRAAAQIQLINSLKSTPGVISATKQPGYVALDQVFLKRFLPTLRNSDITRILNELKLGTITDKQAKGGLRDAIEVLQRQAYIREDAADAIRSITEQQTLSSGRFGSVLNEATSSVRSLRLGYDMAVIGSRLSMNFIQAAAASNPVTASKAIVRAFTDSFSESRYRKTVHSDLYQEFADRGLTNMVPGDTGEILARPHQDMMIDRIPVFGKWGRKMENFQFSRFMSMLKFHVADALYKHYEGRGYFKDAAGGIDQAKRSQLMTDIAMRVNLTTTGYNRTHAGTTRNQEFVTRLLMLSGPWTKGTVANLAGVRKEGVEGDIARRFWAGMAITAVGMAAALSIVSQWDGDKENIIATIDPTEKNSVTNPRSPLFGRIRLPGNEGSIDVSGPILPIAKALLAPVISGVDSTANTADKNVSMLKAGEHTENARLLVDIVNTALGETFGWDATEPVRKWMENRRSIPAGDVWDVIRNENYRGEVIAKRDESRFFKSMEYLLWSITPAIAEAGVDQEHGSTPEYTPSPDWYKRIPSNFFQFNFRPGPSGSGEARSAAEEFLRQHGIRPDIDPIGQVKREPSIPVDQLAEFRLQHPEVEKELDERRRRRTENIQTPRGRDSAVLFTKARQDHADYRDAEIRKLGEQYTRGEITGNQYRHSVSAAWDKYFGNVEGAANTLLGTRDLDEVNNRIRNIYEINGTPSEKFNQAYEEFQQIRSRPGLEDDYKERIRVADARDAFLETEADARYGPGTGKRLRDMMRNIYLERGGEPYAKYYDAQQTMREYIKMPMYRYVSDKEEEGEVRILLARANDRVKYGYATNMRRAILFDTVAAPRIKLMALLVSRMGQRAYNRQRRYFLRANADTLSDFYSDIYQEAA